jgi:hypothetical protein
MNDHYRELLHSSCLIIHNMYINPVCIYGAVLCNRDNEVTVAPDTAEAQSHIGPLLSSGLYHHKIDSTGLTTYAVTGTTASGTIINQY